MASEDHRDLPIIIFEAFECAMRAGDFNAAEHLLKALEEVAAKNPDHNALLDRAYLRLTTSPTSRSS